MSQTFKVRIARTFASYHFIEAKSAIEAEKKAKQLSYSLDFDAEREASHIHDTIEVEEAE